MPQYKVKELSLIGNELHQAGATVEYDGLPAENLEPLDDAGRAKYQEYLDSNAARVRAMREANSESTVGDPAEFMKELAKDRAAQGDMLKDAIAAGIAAGIAQALAMIQPQVIHPEPVVPKGKDKGKDSLV